MKIPCISVMQPHASLISLNKKSIETRSRDFTGGYVGPVAIHASLGKKHMHLCGEEPFYSALKPLTYGLSTMPEKILPFGCIVAVGDLVDVVRIESFRVAANRVESHLGVRLNKGYDRYQREIAFGDYTPGRYMYLLRNVVALDKPIPAKGRLGLWSYEMDDPRR